MSEKTNYHMTPGEFREHGKRVVDWIADYYEWIESQPVLSKVKPGDIRAGLPQQPPTHGEPFPEMLDDVDQIIMPGITHWQSPGFHAYFPSNTSFPSILGDMVSSGLGVQGMLWRTSPACTELETLVLDWTAALLGLPEKFRSTSTGGGVIQDTASSAILCAIIAARERATQGRTNREGCDGMLVMYTSNQANSSVQKAARIAGVGDENIRLIDVDDRFAMRVDFLEQAIQADLAAGKTPFFVCATTGTTSSMAFDPIREISRVCGAVQGGAVDEMEGRGNGGGGGAGSGAAQRDDAARAAPIWLHVDAAMAGTAAVCPEFRAMHDGLDQVDSYCFNPHKWMFTGFDCDCMWVADRSELIAALSILPEYLRTKESREGQVIDYRDWQLPLGRRFRAMKLWFVIRHYGAEGLQYHIRRHVQLAAEFADMVRASPEMEIVAPPALSLVCFAHRKGDAFTERLLEEVNSQGELFASHTRLAGRYAIRMSIAGWATEKRHVDRAWKAFKTAAKRLQHRTRPSPP